MSSFTLDTPHGLISIIDTALKNSSPAVLLLHSTSSSSKTFSHILSSPSLSAKNRIITFDLPGHGSSSKAPEPEKTYCIKGYADLAVHILQHLCVESVVVLGWSVGGHVGIEMIRYMASPTVLAEHKRIELKGLIICGTAPASSAEDVRAGYQVDGLEFKLLRLKDWTDDQARTIARLIAGSEERCEDWMMDDARGADGRARMMVSERFSTGDDQRMVVEADDILIAVVNGAEDEIVQLEYFEMVRWGNLWRGKCVSIEGCHHAPFWERPDVFEGLLGDFLEDAEKGDRFEDTEVCF